MKRLRQRTMAVLWPAFLVACAIEALVFSFFDPLQPRGWGATLELSASAVYTLAFFAFWAVIVVGGALTELLGAPASEINARD